MGPSFENVTEADLLLSGGWLAQGIRYPVYQGLRSGGSAYLSLSNSSGVGVALILIAVGIVIYFVMRFVNTSRGINVKMIFQELPPD